MILPMITMTIMIGSGCDLVKLNFSDITVFDKTEVARHTVVIDNPFTEAEYKMVESASEVSDFLDLDGALHLNLMKGQLNLHGTGQYFLKKVDRTKTVELVLLMKTRRKTETLPTYVTPAPGLEEKDFSHYVRSLVYGGEMLVSYKMEAYNSQDMEKIKAVVKANLETSGTVDAEFEGKLEKIANDLKEVHRADTVAYMTGVDVAGIQAAGDLKGVFRLIKEFPERLEKQVKELKSRAIKFELEPLSTLSGKFKKEETRATNNEVLSQAIDKYEDLLFVSSQYRYTIQQRTVENVKEIEDFKKHVAITKCKMEEAIARLNLSGVFEPDDFKEAFDLYAKDGINIPNRYTREWSALLYAAIGITPPWYPVTKAVNEYIHWGNINCTLPNPEPVVVGFAAAAPTTFGGGSNIQCLEPTPYLGKKINQSDEHSFINGLTYRKPFNGSGDIKSIHAVDLEPRTLLCARCLLTNATSIFTVPAKKNCPGGSKLEYGGFLATGLDIATEPICIDHYTVDELEGFPVRADDETANPIMPMWGNRTQEDKFYYIPCVVCSR